MTSVDFSAEEGEISEAPPLPRFDKDRRVDRVERTRSPRSNNYELSHDVRNHRRSRSPRGFKRPLDDRDRRDEKTFRSSSEYLGRENQRYGRQPDFQSSSRPSYRQYRDPDRPLSRGPAAREYDRSSSHGNGSSNNYRQPNSRHDARRHRTDDRDMYDDYSNKRHRYRSRSRSPQHRTDRERRDRDDYNQVSSADGYLSAQIGSKTTFSSSSNRAAQGQTSSASYRTAKSDQKGPVERGLDNLTISQASDFTQPSAQNTDPGPDLDYDPAQERNEEAEMEAEIKRRRRAREAAYKRALQASTQASSTPESTAVNTPVPARTEVDTPRSGDNMSPMLSPAGFELTEDGLANTNGDAAATGDGPSAADYDPTADMREDERRDEMRHGNVGLHGEARHSTHADESDTSQVKPEDAKEPEDEDDDIDLFAQEIDDEKFQKFKATTSKLQEVANTGHGPTNGVEGGNIDRTNSEGYYKIRAGDMLGPRYRILDSLGSGMFSNVARVEDQTTKKVVAVKIMRNNAALRRGGFTEISILKKLNSFDPDDKKHIIRFEFNFDHKGHLCMVFENLDMNLREVVKKYGRDSGINLRAVQKYAIQMFIALAHMRKHGIIHADLKPDNILVDATRTILKICDLGTAIDRDDAATVANEVTPYLVSRFYRAPEVILGIPYDYAIDMWSIGCTLYELYTGKILFTGRTNNHMLRTIQEIRGKINVKLQRRGQRAPYHFDEHGNFISIDTDEKGNVINQKVIPAFPQSTKLRELLYAASHEVSEDQHSAVPNFHNLIEQCLTLNPDKRITPEEALQHPFLAKPSVKPANKPNHATKQASSIHYVGARNSN